MAKTIGGLSIRMFKSVYLNCLRHCSMWTYRCDGVTGYTSLTRLEASRVPLPLTPQLLPAVKLLNQLGHIDVPTLKGTANLPAAAVFIKFCCLTAEHARKATRYTICVTQSSEFAMALFPEPLLIT